MCTRDKRTIHVNIYIYNTDIIILIISRNIHFPYTHNNIMFSDNFRSIRVVRGSCATARRGTPLPRLFNTFPNVHYKNKKTPKQTL